MITFEQVQEARKRCADSNNAPIKDRSPKNHKKVNKDFREWHRLQTKFRQQNLHILNPLRNVLTTGMLNVLARGGYTNYEKLEYDYENAIHIIKTGETLEKQDTGFTQAYLVQVGPDIYYCSIATLYKFWFCRKD